MFSRRHRSPATVLALVIAVSGLLALPASASSPYDSVVDITFPVAGPVSYIDDYAACRGGAGCPRRHRATDVMAPYGAPVHAAVGGTISFITGLTSSPPSYGYMINIAGDDGRSYSYIHLGRQDRGPTEAYAPGMRSGLRVARGQHIGFNGCSGNASCSAPHLHFEIEDKRITDPYGTNRMNPFASLKDAQRRGDLPGSPGGCTAYALVGDWDASGKDGLGWWCGGRARLRTASGSIIEFRYGRQGDIPLSGDWNGDGHTTIAVVRDRTWHLKNSLSGGAADKSFIYGRVTQGDVPISGNWNGKNGDGIGIIRDGDWHLRQTPSGGAGQISFRYGRILKGDLPLTGDWTDQGRDAIGIVRGGDWHLRHSASSGPGQLTYRYGRVASGDIPVVGDWTGDGRATPGIVRGDAWHLKHSHGGGAADTTIRFSPL